jgi:predicted anti-sigma-YlaC factor YlaD
MKATVEDHLNNCIECSLYYKVLTLSEMIISREKEIEPGPYLASGIMSAIENSESEAEVSKLFRILKPAIMTASLAAAIFAGILIGNVYAPVVKSAPVPIELALMNDGEIELIDVLSTE